MCLRLSLGRMEQWGDRKSLCVMLFTCKCYREDPTHFVLTVLQQCSWIGGGSELRPVTCHNLAGTFFPAHCSLPHCLIPPSTIDDRSKI